MTLPFRLLLPVVLLAAGLLAAQEPVDGGARRQAVWAFLDARSEEARASSRAALERLEGLTLEAVLRILEAPRDLPPRAAGLRPREPWTIPGTAIPTSYALALPEGYDPRRRWPLWILSHGTGGDAARTLRGISGDLRGRGVILAAPQEAPDLAGRGWGGSERERALHLGLIDHLERRYAIDRDRVVLVGWSRGGHCAWDLGLRCPDRFAGLGPVIGGPRLQDFGLLGNLRGLRLHAINGARDDPVLVESVREAKRRLEAMDADAEVVLDPEAGHASFPEQRPALVARLLDARRRAQPPRLTFATFDPSHDRRGYVRITAFGKQAYRPGKPITISGLARMNEERKRRAYRDWVAERMPSVEVTVRDNAFELRTRHVAGLELWIPLDLVDLGRPVTVRIDGRTKLRGKRLEAPGPIAFLEMMRDFAGADPAFRFVARLPFRIPARTR